VKEHLLRQMAALPMAARRSAAREYLQVYLLRLLHEAGALGSWAFVGGTALRLLYGLPRFSEDLDFTFAGAPADPRSVFVRVGSELERAAYDVRVRVRDEKAVASAMFRFGGIPRELGWTRDPRLGVSVRVEVDLRPPSGAGVETTLVQRFFPVAVRHHDPPSLFAGKLQALVSRPWAKGRDWFDLVWFLTEKRGTEPNAELLRNALVQTGHRDAAAMPWREAVRARLRGLDWSAVEADLAPFLERPGDLAHLSPGLVDKLLS